MNKLFFIALAILTFQNTLSQDVYDWKDTAPDANWKQGAAGARWYDNTNDNDLWDEPGFGVLRFNNNHELIMTNNVSGTYNQHEILFATNNTNNRTLNGNPLRFYDFSGNDPKIENQSTGNHTINFDISGDGDSGDPLELNSINGDLTFGGNIDNMGSYIKIYGDNAKTVIFNGVISNTGGFSIEQNSTVIFNSENLYTGGTNLNAGKLEYGVADAIADASNLNLNGGTFSTGATSGYSDTLGTLTLANNATIHLGSGNHSLTFSNSSAEAWTAGATLTIDNWGSGFEGKFYVGNDNTGLTTTQLSQIHFTGYNAGAFILSTGEVVPVNNDSEVDGPAIASQPTDIISSLIDTDGEAIRAFDFDVWDYGSGDGLDTKITQITIQTGGNNDQDWANVLGGVKLSINGGTSFVTTGTPIITSNTIVFPISSGNLLIPEGDVKTVSLYIWLKKTGITDYGVLEFRIPPKSHGFTADNTGSIFADTFAGAISDAIYIDVVATEIQFKQQPTNVAVNTVMTPAVTVAYTDENGNIDTDYDGAGSEIDITASGSSFAGTTTTSVTASNGVCTFSDVEFTIAAVGVTISADSGGAPVITSNPFVVYANCVTSPVSISQDFEATPATPTLTYTTTGTISTSTGNGVNPSDPKYVSGSQGIEVNNFRDAEIIFDTVDASGYSDIEFSVRLASFSGIVGGEGHEADDYVTIEVSRDGNAYHPELRVTGNDNARWSFTSGTGIAVSDYATNLEEFSPAGGGDRTTDGYSTLRLTGLPATSQLKIKIVIRNNNDDEFWVLDDAVLTANDGATTWNGTAWSTGSPPDLLTKAVVAGNYSTASDGNIDACSCQITNAATLTVAANNYLLASHEIDNNGIIIVEDKGSLVQVTETDNNSGSGIYRIHKTTRPYAEYDYTHWASPVQGETIENVFTTHSSVDTSGAGGGTTNGDPYSYPSRIYSHNTANYDDADDDGFDDNSDNWVPAGANEVMSAGKGYIAQGAGSDRPFNPNDIATDLVQSVYFEGTRVNNGSNITLPLVLDNDATNDGGQYDFSNKNLIGNPYPSAIDLQLLKNDADNEVAGTDILGGSAYFWTHDTPIAAGPGGIWNYNFTDTDYAEYNILTDTGNTTHSQTPTKYLASCQSVMIEVNVAGDLHFKNNMRVTGSNDNFFGPISDPQMDKLWINLRDPKGEIRQISVVFIEGADNSINDYDTKRLLVHNETDFYSLATDNNIRLAIQGVSSFQEDKVIPLGMDIVYPGSYNINLDRFEGVFNTQNVYLKDNFTNTLHNLSEGKYEFNVFANETGLINQRFELRFVNETNLSSEDAILESIHLYPNPSQDIFHISWNGSRNIQTTIYNLNGKLVQSTNTNTIDLHGLSQGVYIAKIEVNGRTTQKKLILQ